jgi:hypothetical protein
MSKRMTQYERESQEYEWFQAGRKACDEGIPLEAWPKPDVKYGQLWRRIKSVWQRGWLSNAGTEYQLDPPVKPNPDEELVAKIKRIVIKPIQLRQLIRMFCSKDRWRAAEIADRLSRDGVFLTTGAGRRGSPFVIEPARLMPKN